MTLVLGGTLAENLAGNKFIELPTQIKEGRFGCKSKNGYITRYLILDNIS